MTVSIRAEALEKLSHQRSMESGTKLPTSVSVVVGLSTAIHWKSLEYVQSKSLSAIPILTGILTNR
jgi:hypothetical protein